MWPNSQRKIVPLHADGALAARAIKGERQAFDELVRRYTQPIYRYLLRLGSGPGEAEDLTQEVFIKAWRSLENLEEPAAFKSWLYTIATNASFSHFRKARRIVKEEAFANDGEQADPVDRLLDQGPAVDEQLQRSDLKERLGEAIAQLPSPFKEAVVLRDVDEMPYEEIARILGQNMGTVKSRIARGRLLIQEILAGVYP